VKKAASGLIFCLLALHPAIALSQEVEWPQWRGPGGLGISSERRLPAEWSATKNVQWKTAIPGRGHSSPVVWGKRVFLTTSLEGPVVPGAKAVSHIGWKGEANYVHPDAVGADREWTLKVLCLDAASGKLLWERTAYQGRVYDDRNRKNTYASGTPATDGKHVYALFDAEGLYCYDYSGKLIWKVSLGKIAKGGMGYGMSPVLFGNLIILQCDQELGEGSFIAALDKRSGKEVWRVPRTTRRTWATPLLVQAAGRWELVTSGAETVMAYDPLTGRELWRSKGTVSHAIPSAVYGHGMVFFSAGSQAKHAFALRLGGSGDLTGTPSAVWQYDKGTAYVPSPILYEDYLYLMTDKGLVTCLDARTGKLQYEGGRVPVPATFTASLVAYEGKILLCSEDGDTFVLKAGPQHEILRTNSIGEPIFASPAISRGSLFIRGEKHLFCIRRSSRDDSIR
jgi:outer membrane protein assembly factor BamB